MDTLFPPLESKHVGLFQLLASQSLSERETHRERGGGRPRPQARRKKDFNSCSNARDSRLPAGLPVDTCSDVQMRLQSDLLLLRLVFNDLCSTLEKQLFCEEPTAIPMAGY